MTNEKLRKNKRKPCFSFLYSIPSFHFSYARCTRPFGSHCLPLLSPFLSASFHWVVGGATQKKAELKALKKRWKKDGGADKDRKKGSETTLRQEGVAET